MTIRKYDIEFEREVAGVWDHGREDGKEFYFPAEAKIVLKDKDGDEIDLSDASGIHFTTDDEWMLDVDAGEDDEWALNDGVFPDFMEELKKL